jgi:hypothetical protein
MFVWLPALVYIQDCAVQLIHVWLTAEALMQAWVALITGPIVGLASMPELVILGNACRLHKLMRSTQ